MIAAGRRRKNSTLLYAIAGPRASTLSATGDWFAGEPRRPRPRNTNAGTRRGAHPVTAVARNRVRQSALNALPSRITGLRPKRPARVTTNGWRITWRRLL